MKKDLIDGQTKQEQTVFAVAEKVQDFGAGQVADLKDGQTVSSVAEFSAAAPTAAATANAFNNGLGAAASFEVIDQQECWPMRGRTACTVTVSEEAQGFHALAVISKYLEEGQGISEMVSKTGAITAASKSPTGGMRILSKSCGEMVFRPHPRSTFGHQQKLPAISQIRVLCLQLRRWKALQRLGFSRGQSSKQKRTQPWKTC